MATGYAAHFGGVRGKLKDTMCSWNSTSKGERVTGGSKIHCVPSTVGGSKEALKMGSVGWSTHLLLFLLLLVLFTLHIFEGTGGSTSPHIFWSPHKGSDLTDACSSAQNHTSVGCLTVTLCFSSINE